MALLHHDYEKQAGDFVSLINENTYAMGRG